MADITDQHDNATPSELDDSHGNGAQESRGIKRQRPSAGDDDDDDDEKGGRERRKIEIKFISDKSRRHITFSKRKAGIMKKVSRMLLPEGNCLRGTPFSIHHHPPSPSMRDLSKWLSIAKQHVCLQEATDEGYNRFFWDL